MIINEKELTNGLLALATVISLTGGKPHPLLRLFALLVASGVVIISLDKAFNPVYNISSTNTGVSSK